MGAPPISGRYRGVQAGAEVELRVDIDGPRPMQCISADYTDVSGSQRNYLRSMRLDAPKVTRGAGQVTISGVPSFSQGAPPRTVTVTIAPLASGAPTATLVHTDDSGRRTFSCVCDFESALFRHVQLDEACEIGVQVPAPFDTASLPSGSPPRMLDTIAAYADAGIDLASTGPPTIIQMSEAGEDDAWSDAELQAAMALHFSLLGDGPRWAIWLLHAVAHTDPDITGLMFDRTGPQRQGCAVFVGHDPSASDVMQQARLYNCVHELGHGMNLVHCWQRSFDTPPIPSRPDALSWMNYPERHAGGPQDFFRAFAYQFDDPEVTHLRHAFRDDVIMGGDPFMGDGARRTSGGWATEGQDPSLRLTLRAPDAIMQSVPVSVGLQLSATAQRPRIAPTSLDPRAGAIDIAIRRPNGDETLFEPLLRHCRRTTATTLLAGGPPMRDVAFIHYGRQGFGFEQPGVYAVQARYTGPDGEVALSPVASLRVRAPVSRDDRAVAALVAGDDEVGTLLAVAGSRAPALDRGNATLLEILRNHPAHPLAGVARIVRATGLARPFKNVHAAGNVTTTPAEPAEAAALIRPLVDLTAAERAASAVADPAGQRLAFAAALARGGTMPGVAAPVTAFLAGMRFEIASARGGLAPTQAPPSPAATAPPGPARTVPPPRSTDPPRPRPGS